MSCTSCGIRMRYLGADQEGKQCFECRQDGCPRRHTRMCRWWESGTDFQVEEVPSH
jgi:hypothetical protein